MTLRIDEPRSSDTGAAADVEGETRYDKLAENFLAMIQLASIRLATREDYRS